MKKIIYLLAITFIAGCNKDNSGGKLVLNMSYNCSQKGNADVKSNFAAKVTYYSQFGDYITSVTPTSFKGKFLDMRIQNWDKNGTIWNRSLNLIDNNTDISDSTRLADFSNNSTVQLIPDLTNFLTGNDVEFNIFVFIPLFFYQEFELPAQYDRIIYLQYLGFGGEPINFSSFGIGGERNGHFVKGSYEPLMAPIFDSTWTGYNGNFPQGPKTYVFGSTNSTYLFYSKDSHVQSIDNPLGQGGYIIRSNSYNSIKLRAVPEGETKNISGTLSFNINNLIQIYAGKDNIPYTSDDIFVYAPQFWERLTVDLTSN